MWDCYVLQCEVIRGQGFRRGSYKCVCKQGYYFPDLEVPIEQRYFNGTYAEEQYALYTQVGEMVTEYACQEKL